MTTELTLNNNRWSYFLIDDKNTSYKKNHKNFNRGDEKNADMHSTHSTCRKENWKYTTYFMYVS